MDRATRDALMASDAGRCSSTIECADAQGRPALYRCVKNAWHRRAHRASLGHRTYLRWPGHGSLFAGGLPQLDRAAMDELRARARAKMNAYGG